MKNVTDIVVDDTNKNCESQPVETSSDKSFKTATEGDTCNKYKKRISFEDESSNEDDIYLNEYFENSISHKVHKIAKADDVKLIEKNKFHLPVTPSPKATNDISQIEEKWQIKYNTLQQHNEKLTFSITATNYRRE